MGILRASFVPVPTRWHGKFPREKRGFATETAHTDQILGENISYTYDSLKRLATATASAAPYVKNPSFEQVSFGPSFWTTGSPAANYQNTGQGSHSGTYSLHTQPAGASFSQNFSCQAGATFTVSGWYKLDAQASATVSAQVNSSSYQSSTLSPTSTWTQFTYHFTPSGCGGFTGILQIGGGAWTLAGGGISTGTVRFDDLSVTAPTISGDANLLSDPGFETPQSPTWTLNNHSRPTYLSFHGGQTSLRLGPADSATQTVSGAIPNTAYTVSAWCDIPSSSTTATLTVGGAATTANTGGWQLISVPGNSDASGNLAIALSVSNTSGAQVYWDDLTVSMVNPANPTPTLGQSFGYDGFGNLLSETPTAGSAPSLNVTADPATNRVVSTGVQYDAAGNMTNDGSQAYAFDEANRILTVGSYSYTYSGVENKRILVYNSANASAPTATFNLYGPDGKRLGWYRYGTSNGWTSTTTQGFTNYLYLGNKPLNYAEDRTGSNRSGGSYYPYGNPYGNVNAGAENQSFGTYVQDSGSGLLYADQRYYNPGFGRFMTADRSNANANRTNSISWNRYAYTNGDPINAVDPTGQYLYYDEDSDLYYDDVGNFYLPEELDGELGSDLFADACASCTTDGGDSGASSNGPSGFEYAVGAATEFVKLTTKCGADQLGITDLVAVGGVLAGQPWLDAGGKFVGATGGTSLASSALSNLGIELPFNLIAPTNLIFRGVLSSSSNLGRVVGRWIPFVGWAVLAYDAYEIGSCVVSGWQPLPVHEAPVVRPPSHVQDR